MILICSPTWQEGRAMEGQGRNHGSIMVAIMTMQMATCPECSADCTFTTCNAYCNAVRVPPSTAQPPTTACIYTNNKVKWHALAQTMQPPLYANRTAYAGYLYMQYQQNA